MPVRPNEHGDEIDTDWKPGNPALRGAHPGEALAVPAPKPQRPDELPHSKRRELGLDNDDPDEGYDPAADHLGPRL